MTVDREQIRREAESGHPSRAKGHVLALLAELEQAERERDEARARAEIAEISLVDARENSVADLPSLLHCVEGYEARLAKVPALVVAIKEVAAQREDWERGDDEHPFDIVSSFWRCVSTADEALAEWERE